MDLKSLIDLPCIELDTVAFQIDNSTDLLVDSQYFLCTPLCGLSDGFGIPLLLLCEIIEIVNLWFDSCYCLVSARMAFLILIVMHAGIPTSFHVLKTYEFRFRRKLDFAIMLVGYSLLFMLCGLLNPQASAMKSSIKEIIEMNLRIIHFIMNVRSTTC